MYNNHRLINFLFPKEFQEITWTLKSVIDIIPAQNPHRYHPKSVNRVKVFRSFLSLPIKRAEALFDGTKVAKGEKRITRQSLLEISFILLEFAVKAELFWN